MLLAAEDVEACHENVLAPTRQPAASSALAMNSTEPAGYVTGLRRKVYQVLGWASVGMAVVGFALPGIPGAPFVVLAGYFFIRSSPRSHAWLLQSRWFGPILRDWEQHRAVRPTILGPSSSSALCLASWASANIVCSTGFVGGDEAPEAATHPVSTAILTREARQSRDPRVQFG